MKKCIWSLMALLFVWSFASCSSDDKSEVIENGKLYDFSAFIGNYEMDLDLKKDGKIENYKSLNVNVDAIPNKNQLKLTLSLPNLTTRLQDNNLSSESKMILTVSAKVVNNSCIFEIPRQTSGLFTLKVGAGTINNTRLDLELTFMDSKGVEYIGHWDGKLFPSLSSVLGEYFTNQFYIGANNGIEGDNLYNQKVLIEKTTSFNQLKLIIKDFRRGLSKEDIEVLVDVKLGDHGILVLSNALKNIELTGTLDTEKRHLDFSASFKIMDGVIVKLDFNSDEDFEPVVNQDIYRMLGEYRIEYEVIQDGEGELFENQKLTVEPTEDLDVYKITIHQVHYLGMIKDIIFLTQLDSCEGLEDGYGQIVLRYIPLTINMDNYFVLFEGVGIDAYEGKEVAIDFCLMPESINKSESIEDLDFSCAVGVKVK